MISSLCCALLLSFFKFLIVESLLVILILMEMISLLIYFFIISLNVETMSMVSSTTVLLTIMISESVLGLSLFVNLMRSTSMDKILSFKLKP